MIAVTLSEGELVALREEAETMVLTGAGERLRWYHPDRCDSTPDAAREEAHQRMIAAAEVYGALRNSEGPFSEAKGLPRPAESVEVQFTEAALAWMKRLRDEIRNMLNEQRGSVEVNLDYTPRQAFLLFVLDGIQMAQEGGES